MNWINFLIICYLIKYQHSQEIASDYSENIDQFRIVPHSDDDEANITLPMIDKSLLINLIDGFNDRYKFKNIIFFISENYVKNKNKTARLFVDFWNNLPLKPIIVVVNKTTKILGLINTPSLAIIITTHLDDEIMAIASASLQRLHNIKSIFVLWPLVSIQNNLSNVIKDIYSWIWDQQFTKTLIITNWNNIYIMEPYPTLTIINKTDNWHIQDFFVNHVHNMKGYKIYSPICYDLPRVFQYDQNKISGTSARFMETFLKYRNCSLINNGVCSMKTKQTINLKNMLTEISKGTLEISVHTFMQFFNTLDGSSYPLSIDDFCIIVPFKKKSPEYLHLRIILDDASWYLLIGSLIYLTIALWLCTPPQQRDIGKTFLQSICSLLSLTPLSVVNISTRRMRFVAVLLFILGFILVNIYLSKLASRLTIFISDHQIDTVDDIIEANLSILLLSHEYPIMEAANFPQKFLDLLIIVERSEIDAYRESFNTSFGYTIPTDRWELLNMQQRYLDKPIFRLTTICLGPFYLVYPLRNESHLYSSLKQFTMRTQQSGLQVYWKRATYADILSAEYAKILVGIEEKKPLTLEFFYYIWIIWTIGLIISAIAFTIEIIAFFFRNNKLIIINKSFKLRDLR